MSSHNMYPCGKTRGEFVWEMGSGFAGLALANLLAGDGFFSSRALAKDAAPSANPTAPREPQFPARAKACIFLMMNGRRRKSIHLITNRNWKNLPASNCPPTKSSLIPVDARWGS